MNDLIEVIIIGDVGASHPTGNATTLMEAMPSGWSSPHSQEVVTYHGADLVRTTIAYNTSHIVLAQAYPNRRVNFRAMWSTQQAWPTALPGSS